MHSALVQTAAGCVALAEGIPLCILGDWENYAVENLHSKRKVFDEQGGIDDFQGHRMSQLKGVGPDCGECSRVDICEGPWSDYPELFSWKEFRPIPKGDFRR